LKTETIESLVINACISISILYSSNIKLRIKNKGKILKNNKIFKNAENGEVDSETFLRYAIAYNDDYSYQYDNGKYPADFCTKHKILLKYFYLQCNT